MCPSLHLLSGQPINSGAAAIKSEEIVIPLNTVFLISRKPKQSGVKELMEFSDQTQLVIPADSEAYELKNNPTSIVKPSVVAASSVHELLECPVCTNSMYPPIHQCPNGHTLCSECKSRVNNRCPTWRYELGNIRCLALEKVAASLELPCKYQSYGFQEIFPYYSNLKHEAQCTFRPYNCPYAGSECKVVGDILFFWCLI